MTLKFTLPRRVYKEATPSLSSHSLSTLLPVHISLNMQAKQLFAVACLLGCLTLASAGGGGGGGKWKLKAKGKGLQNLYYPQQQQYYPQQSYGYSGGHGQSYSHGYDGYEQTKTVYYPVPVQVPSYKEEKKEHSKVVVIPIKVGDHGYGGGYGGSYGGGSSYGGGGYGQSVAYGRSSYEPASYSDYSSFIPSYSGNYGGHQAYEIDLDADDSPYSNILPAYF